MIQFILDNREAFIVLGILTAVYVVMNILVHRSLRKQRLINREKQNLYNDIVGGD